MLFTTAPLFNARRSYWGYFLLLKGDSMQVNKQILAVFVLSTAMLWCFVVIPDAKGANQSNENTVEILRLKSEIVKTTAKIDEHVALFMADSGKSEGRIRLSNYQLCTSTDVDQQAIDPVTKKSISQQVNELRQSAMSKRVTLERMIEKLIASQALPSASENLNSSKVEDGSRSIQELEKSKKDLMSSIEIIQRTMIRDLAKNKAKLDEGRNQELAFLEMLKGNTARFPGFAAFFPQSPRDSKACRRLELYQKYREARSLGFETLPAKLDLLAKQLRKEVNAIDGRIAALQVNTAPRASIAEAPIPSESKDETRSESAL